MTCTELRELAHAYVDGEFESAERSEADTHLTICEACGTLVGRERAFLDALHASVKQVEAPAALRASIRARLDDESRPSGAWAVARQWWPVPLSLGAAAAGAMVWVALSARAQPSPQQQLAADLHRHALPLDFVAGDIASLDRWSASTLAFNPRIPTLALRPVGARVVSVDHAQPALQVTYGDPQAHPATLLVVYDPSQRLSGEARRVNDREVYLANLRGYNVVSWRKDAVVYTLTSDLSESEALALVPAEQR